MNSKEMILKLAIATATFIWIIGSWAYQFPAEIDNGALLLVHLVIVGIGIGIGVRCWFSPIFKKWNKDASREKAEVKE